MIFIHLFIIESYMKYKIDRKTETESEKKKSSTYNQDAIGYILFIIESYHTLQSTQKCIVKIDWKWFILRKNQGITSSVNF